MTSATGKRLPPHHTVRSVRTVRRHLPSAVRAMADVTPATVRRPSDASGLLSPPRLCHEPPLGRCALSARPTAQHGRSGRSARRRSRAAAPRGNGSFRRGLSLLPVRERFVTRFLSFDGVNNRSGRPLAGPTPSGQPGREFHVRRPADA